MKRRILSIIIIVTMVLTGINVPQKEIKLEVQAQVVTHTSGVYEYTLNDDEEATITKYTGSETDIQIPDKIDGYKVNSLGNQLFLNKKNIKSINIPDIVQTIGDNAFEGTSLTELVLPGQIKSIGNAILKGVKGVTEITIPNGVTGAGFYGPFNGSAITKATFVDGIAKIPDNMFRNCTTLKEVMIPDSVTVIGIRAFDQCTQLGNIGLPDGVTSIGDYAFACTALNELELPKQLESIGYSIITEVKGVTEITIPNGVTGAGFYGPFNGSAITKATFANGITKIPDNMFRNCTTLKEVMIPDSVTVIGSRAFDQCTQLSNMELPNGVTSIGEYAFSGCDALTVFCNYKAMGPVYCINQGVTFGPSESRYIDNENRIIDRKGSMYYANTDSLSASGVLPFSIKYKVKNKWKGELSNQSIVSYVPQYCDLIEDSIYINGKLASNYSYNKNSRQLRIPFSGETCEINYSVKVRSKENIVSYAYISATKKGMTTTENIGTLNEEFDGLTLNVADVVSSSQMQISGVAPGTENVDIYVDGIKKTTTSPLKNGFYNAEVVLDNPIDEYPYTIEVKTIDEYENEISVSKNIIYQNAAAQLNSLVLEYYEHTTKKQLELISNEASTPKVYFMPNTEFTFKVDIQNTENIEKVYITSTRNNEKKVIEAKYDSVSGLYIASGYFDQDDTSYVPGSISVEYKTKTKDIVASENYDISTVMNVANVPDSAKVTYQKNTKEELEATIDFSETLEDVKKAEIKAAIKYIDKTAGTSIEDIKDWLGFGKTVLEYIVPGDGNKKYIMNLDLSDKENVIMLMYDAADSGLTVADKIVSAKIDFSKFGVKGYSELVDLQGKIGYASKIAKFAYSAYGICDDYNDLVKEIDKSSTITDKITAREKALELKDDQMAFLVLTTVMPLIVTGATMTGPALVFSGMLAVMTGVSSVFWNARIANIKNPGINLKWIVDPSGYVYDLKDDQRIEDAIVTAYWIPYDQTDDFYSKKPLDSDYGTKWIATEYQQENPIKTNVEGKYAWDVPEGWWRVKCEKQGYETYWSDWMTVPPIQTEVNIGLMRMGESSDNEITVKNIMLDKTTLELTEGDIVQLTATITPQDASNKKVTWTSDNEEVATVENGKVTARKSGTATITASVENGEIKATCKITVIGHDVTGVELSKNVLSLDTGNCALLKATVLPEDAENKEVMWTSSDESVATVDASTGIVMGVAKGEAEIKVTTKAGDYTAACKVTVSEPEDAEEIIPVTEIRIPTDSGLLPEDSTIEAGNQFEMPISFEPEDATNKDVIWISSDEEIAEIDESGTVTAKKAGEVTIIAVSVNGGKKAEYTFTVTGGVLTAIQLDKKQLWLHPGDEYQLKATPLPEGAIMQLEWSSDEEGVAIVDDQGMVTAISAGGATITVTDKKHKNITTICKVTVTDETTEVSSEQDKTTQQGTSTEASSTEKPTPGPSTTQSGQQGTTRTSDSTMVNNISIARVSGLKIKAKGSRKIEIKWAGVTGIKYYQVQISMKKNFKKGNKVRIARKTKLTWKKLKKGKTYYVRVRAFINGQYGAWSKAKKVKVR